MVMEEPQTQPPIQVPHPAHSRAAPFAVSLLVKCRPDELPVTLREESPAQQFMRVLGNNRMDAVIDLGQGLGARRHVYTGPDVCLHMGPPVRCLRTRADAADFTRLDPNTEGDLGAAGVSGPAIVHVALILQAEVQ